MQETQPDGLSGATRDARVDVGFSAGQGGTPVTLTPQERASVNARALAGLVRVVLAQLVMALAAAVTAGLVGGWAAAGSALAGAGVYFLPNTAFACRLMVGLMSGRMASPFVFLIGEMIKLAVAVVLLWVLSQYAQEWLVWPAVLWGLILTLKGYFLLLMFRKF